MSETKYKIRYIPLFYEDLEETLKYISVELKNPDAALNLLNKTEKAILKRLNNPKIFEPFHSIKQREHPYYRIIVDNFSVFYVIIGDVMEVRRFLYNGRNINNII